MTVSAIIPTFNGRSRIGRTLAALLAQPGAADLEIIVVDDGSTDGTAASCAGLDDRIRVLSQPNQGPAAARNLGARQAKGDILLFTDDDCVPDPNWLPEMLKPFAEDPEVVGVKGAYRTEQPELLARFVQLEYEDKYDLMAKDRYIDFIDTYSAGFRREVFLRFGGYDTSFPVPCAEDVELSFRMSREGLRMVFNPRAVVAHTHPNDAWKYLKKKYKFAYWRMVAVRKNPEKLVRDSHTPQLMKLQLLFPPLLAGCLLLGAVSGWFALLALGGAALFLLSSLPMIRKALGQGQGDLALAAPGLLLLRAGAQFAGVAGGLVRALGEAEPRAARRISS